MYGKDLLYGLRRWLTNYNLFMLDENDYHDDDDEVQTPATILKRQRYSTRLYILLLIVSLYGLLFVALVQWETRVITVELVTSSLFRELYSKHADTLSCPCSETIVPYERFVSNAVSFHPLCTSVFVKNEWIEALYLSSTSTFSAMDFRMTASSQFELLAALCSLSQDAVAKALASFNDNQFIALQLLPENEVFSQINASIELVQTSTPTQITLPLRFLQIATQANTLVSALNTNLGIGVEVEFYNVIWAPIKYLNQNATDAYSSTIECGSGRPTAPAGFYRSYGNSRDADEADWSSQSDDENSIASVQVHGFFVGCVPLDAALASTLDCLYNISCLAVLPVYFPSLIRGNRTWNKTLSSINQKRPSLSELLDKLLVQEWLTDTNYTKFFDECDSASCTYTETRQANFAYTITLFISIYGGLTIVLRAITVFLINFCFQAKYSLAEKRTTDISRIVRWMKQLNLFKMANNRTAVAIEKQRITTRIYLATLAGVTLILTLFYLLNGQMTTGAVSYPSLIEYKHLQSLYSDSLKCPCSNVSLPFAHFVSLDPRLHNVCYGDFVGDDWSRMLTELGENIIAYTSEDIVGLGKRHFQLLSSICQLANRTIDDALRRLASQSLVTLHTLTEFEFEVQLNSTLKLLIQSLTVQFALIIDAAHLFTQVDQPFTMTRRNAYPSTRMSAHMKDHSKTPKVDFLFSGVQKGGSGQYACYCVTDPYCQGRILYSGWETVVNDTDIPYMVPGGVGGCFVIDSLLLSTLECFYQNSCLAMYYDQISSISELTSHNFPWFYIQPLIYSSQSSHFALNDTLSVIVKGMMVEQWNSSYSFDRYYALCAPSRCTYTQMTRGNSLSEVMIKLISMMGALTAILRLVMPEIVQVVLGLIRPRVRQHSSGRTMLTGQVKAAPRKLVKLFRDKLTGLNIFPMRSFGNSLDSTQAKRLARLATRLYIILLILAMIILALYVIVQPELLTKTFVEPSRQLYDRLAREHLDTLQCPCSSISMTYERFVQIAPAFHQVCSSPFSSNQWRTSLTRGLSPDLSAYLETDYRRFLSAHLQFLSGLCTLAIQSMKGSIDRFLSSFFIAPRLLPEAMFSARVNGFIDQSESNALMLFPRLLSLIRTLNHGNAIISAYNTNFEYIAPSRSSHDDRMITHPKTYDGCSCALNMSCTTEAVFARRNSSNVVPIAGLRMGCTPSEAFLASTLECFYNTSCIKLIDEQINNITMTGTKSNATPLSTDSSRFPIHTRMIDLVQALFIENWSVAINYSEYFDQCSPTLCVYTYKQQLNSLYTVTLLLGLYGGLSLILKWICPIVIRLLFGIYQVRKKQTKVMSVKTTRSTPGTKRTSPATITKCTAHPPEI